MIGVRNRANDELVRKFVIGLINIFGSVVSFTTVGIGIEVGSETFGDKTLLTIYVIIGTVMALVSLLSLIGLCFGELRLFWVYMGLMPIIIVFYFVVTIFVLSITSNHPDRVNNEYRLHDYSSWMRKKFTDDDNTWNRITRSLNRKDVCAQIYTVYGTIPTLDEFHKMPFSSIQAGCCMPTKDCNFEYISPFSWNKPVNLMNSTNADCGLWDNDASTLCYRCSSCKAGFIHNISHIWNLRSTAAIIIILPLLVVCYYCGCHVLWSWARESKKIQPVPEVEV